MLPRIYSFLGRWLHFRAKFLKKREFFVLNGGFCCGNGGFVAEREGMFCREKEEILRKNRGGILEKLRMYFGEIGACSWHLTSQAEAQKKENHTLSEDLCGFLACYPKIVFPF